MATNIPNIESLELQFKRGNELQMMAAGLLNDVTAQLVERIKHALETNDVMHLHETDKFMTEVMWDCGDCWDVEPEGVINLMRFYPQEFTEEQVAVAVSLLVLAAAALKAPVAS